MKRLLKGTISLAVDWLAARIGFSFPAKYSWRWKLEALMGQYEPETTRLFKKVLKPGMTFVDVGAHIGYFSRLAAKLVGEKGTVRAFEPVVENFPLLKSNLAMFPNAKIFQEALSDHAGTISF